MLSKKLALGTMSEDERSHALTYGSRYVEEPVPKYTLPEESMPANVAYQIIHDELNLDGNPIMKKRC